METLTVEDAASELENLVTQVQENNSPFRITSKKGNVMLLSEESYKNLIVALELSAAHDFMPFLQPVES